MLLSLLLLVACGPGTINLEDASSDVRTSSIPVGEDGCMDGYDPSPTGDGCVPETDEGDTDDTDDTGDTGETGETGDTADTGDTDDTDDTAPIAVDFDGDGFADTIDCDDGDAAVNPDATEVCNGRDDDCDGGIDNSATDAQSYYPDTDGDGYGSFLGVRESCTPIALHATEAGDCNDGDPTVNPGALEVLDDTDNDCNGVVDSTDLCPTDGVVLAQQTVSTCEGNPVVIRLDAGCLTNVAQTGSDDGLVTPSDLSFSDPAYVSSVRSLMWYSDAGASGGTVEFSLSSDQGEWTWTVEILDCY